MKKLLIILGPTAVGKTDFSIETALKVGSPIISCDSRQIYKEMTIGTAVPSAEQRAAVQHYFIQTHSVTELYTAGKYEVEALELIRRLFAEGHETLVMAGGSGFYIDAVCNGLDDFPDTDPELRESLSARLREEGVESLRLDLKRLDPETYAAIDIANGRRVIRALEVCLMTGRPFSSFKTAQTKPREFEIEKIGLVRPRAELYERIDERVLKMIDAGLVEEVRSLLPLRHHTALHTVGYQEIFAWFDYLAGQDAQMETENGKKTFANGKKILPKDGETCADFTKPETANDTEPVTSLDRAIELIQRNTRHYARKQLSYFRRDPSIRWIMQTNFYKP